MGEFDNFKTAQNNKEKIENLKRYKDSIDEALEKFVNLIFFKADIFSNILFASLTCLTWLSIMNTENVFDYSDTFVKILDYSIKLSIWIFVLTGILLGLSLIFKYIFKRLTR